MINYFIFNIIGLQIWANIRKLYSDVPGKHKGAFAP
jgi:hypothetical protein